MFLRAFSRKRRTGSVPVYLNVYDLTPVNGYAYWLGLGIYHSGVQVHGVEYAYGAHDHPTTGIFEGESRRCPGFRFRKSILIGRTDLGPREVRAMMDKLAAEYAGNAYHLVSRNCNHFCNDVCMRLTGEPIPRWVNRLANLGFLCNCVLPVGLHVAAVRQKGSATAMADEEKGRVELIAKEESRDRTTKSSSKYLSSSPPPASSSSSSSVNSSPAPSHPQPPPPSDSVVEGERRWRSQRRKCGSSSPRAALVVAETVAMGEMN